MKNKLLIMGMFITITMVGCGTTQKESSVESSVSVNTESVADQNAETPTVADVVVETSVSEGNEVLETVSVASLEATDAEEVDGDFDYPGPEECVIVNADGVEYVVYKVEGGKYMARSYVFTYDDATQTWTDQEGVVYTLSPNQVIE